MSRRRGTRITLEQLATYIVRDGARLVASDRFGWRTYVIPGWGEVEVTAAQYDRLWAIIDRMPVR